MRSFLFSATAAVLLAAPVLAFAQAPVIAAPGTNPPGTAASRALDRAAGTNTSGAYPSQSDGTAANPPGTAAGRAVDKTLGTNETGANPTHKSV